MKLEHELGTKQILKNRPGVLKQEQAFGKIRETSKLSQSALS